ncbi:COG1361 S-layer family protein [Marinisporobacter balticus]|uniref:LPXTG-motif cell wall-anchored protein n=1 Tax=Marinisporobacter balticus TaxID=2018667 RepID=A0A4R2KUK4_9FIRM|nr:hypothetical protein [Marinisporobacter balticus]TCO74809.1 hypothetical protein EV214_11172 [Marinisporobacter balticus]
MKRRILTLSIVLMMAFSICNMDTFTSYADTNLIIGRNREVPVFESGEEVRLGIPIENIGEDSIKDVTISLDTSDLKSFPFEIEKMSTTKRIASIHGKSDEDIGFYLKVAMNAEAKTYPIKVSVSYDGGTASETVYVKIEENRQKPSLELMDVKFEGNSVSAGQSSVMKLEIQNEGETMAKDVEISFEGLKAEAIRLDNYMNVPKIKEIKPKHFHEIPLKIYANEDLKSGTYELDLSIKYKDEYNHEYEKKKKIYVPVDGAGDQELDFGFENLAYPVDGVKTSQDFDIAFDLKNLSGKDAKNLKVSIDAGAEILPKSASVKNIKSLNVGESIPMTFKLFAKDGIESKNYPVKINVEYGLKDSKSEEKNSLSQYVGIFIKGDNSKLTPRIIIDNYNYGKEYIQTGETFPLNISFFNTNKSASVKNIKVSISSEGDAFAPVGSSNSFFIDEIGASNRVNKTIKLKSKSDAEQKMYNITADIEYEDSTGKAQTAKEIIGVNVIQEVKFKTSDVKIPEEVFVGGNASLSIDFYNLGRGILRNMMIHTEGGFEVNSGSTYIGNIDAGKDDYYDVTVIPNKEGKGTGKIIFEFEDTVGNPYKVEKDFEIEVMKEPEMPPMDPEMEMEGQKGSSSKKWIWIGGGVLLVGGIGFVVRRKRKKKAEEVSIDE